MISARLVALAALAVWTAPAGSDFWLWADRAIAVTLIMAALNVARRAR